MNKPQLTMALLFLLTLASFWILPGCNDSTSPVAETGSATITCLPAGIDATWNLAGPGSYSHDGTGDETLNGRVVGSYTITWNEVASYVTPQSETLSLPADGSVEFNGTYTPRYGTISITGEPGHLYVRWNLTGPGGLDMDSFEDATLNDMDPGDYTITWAEQSSWITPPPETLTLAGGGSIRFTATYTPGPNTIYVTSEPDTVAAGWGMVGPNSFSAGGSGGVALLSTYITPGDYTMTWVDVAGWITPDPETQTMVEDGTLHFHGVFIAVE